MKKSNYRNGKGTLSAVKKKKVLVQCDLEIRPLTLVWNGVWWGASISVHVKSRKLERFKGYYPLVTLKLSFDLDLAIVSGERPVSRYVMWSSVTVDRTVQ